MNLLVKATVLTAVLLAPEVPALGQDAPIATGAPAYSAMQLEQLLAPIALYPDQLLGPILMGSTYPLEIVAADRWLQNAANASLQGAQLAEALQQEPWDQSIKALVPFPQVLNLLDTDLDWTEQLGTAFLSQQAEVMDAVQRLRVRAQTAGTLRSSEREDVQTLGQAVEITPADPDIVYVPVYDPLSVYGEWPSSQYPPDDFIVTGYPFGSFIGTPIVSALWGWSQWDWRHHRLNIIARPVATPFATPVVTPGPDRPPAHPAPWRHDPAHHGLAPTAGPTWAPPSVRSPIPAPGLSSAPALPSAPGLPSVPAVHPFAVGESRLRAEPAFVVRPAPVRQAAPVYESFGHALPVSSPAQHGASARAPEPAGRGGNPVDGNAVGGGSVGGSSRGLPR